MLYTKCAACARPFEGDEVVLIDGRALCTSCAAQQPARRTQPTLHPHAATAKAIALEPPADPAAPPPARFHVRVAEAPAPALHARFLEDARAWAAGRHWPLRAVLLFWFATMLWQLMKDPLGWMLIDGLNLGIHEMGHYAFYWLGETMSVAGGSLLQVLAPIGAGIMFYRQRDYFAIAIASCWLGTALHDVGTYAADARAQALPLVSPTSADPLHDWYYLLASAGLLRQDQQIGGLLHFAGVLALLAGLGFGAWLCLVMRNSARTQSAA